MPDPIREPETPPRPDASVRNQAVKPPGILPKNAQTWVIAGLSAVMVAAIALSGNSGGKNKAPTTQPRQASVIDPSAARIAEYRNRLEEETRKLAAEQAALNQARQTAGADPHPVTVPMQASAPGSTYPAQPALDDGLKARTQLEVDKERKEYASLFASNVALSYRKDSQTKESTPAARSAVPPEFAPGTYPYIYAVPPTARSPSAGANQGAAPGPDVPSHAPVRTPLAERLNNRDPRSPEQAETAKAFSHAPPDPELTRAEGRSHRLLEGTILETVLTNRLTGSLPGPVNSMLTTDVYSHDRQHLLIPQGSRVLGEVKPVNSFGQQRLAVLFHRIIMPDGYSVTLDQFQGLNQIGETGLRDQVNHHYVQIFGVSIAIGAIAGLAQANTQYGFSISAADAYRQGFATSLSQSALRILDRFLNVLPTFTVREGHRIKIYLAADLLLPAYDWHTVPSDF